MNRIELRKEKKGTTMSLVILKGGEEEKEKKTMPFIRFSLSGTNSLIS